MQNHPRKDYRKMPPTNKTWKNCNPMIVNKSILATGDLEYVSEDDLKYKCNCINKKTCFEIFNLLKQNKLEEAKELLDTI